MPLNFGIAGWGCRRSDSKSNSRSTSHRRLELLEKRYVLNGDVFSNWYEKPSSEWFFQQDFGEVNEPTIEYVVRLSEDHLDRQDEVVAVFRGLVDGLPRNIPFELRGLGLPGLVSIRTTEVSAAFESQLAGNASVDYFYSDPGVTGQDLGTHLLDNDSGGIAAIDAWDAWCTSPWSECNDPENRAIGSPRTVVAVVDSGVDYSHPNLYRNIWINQDEIPTEIRNQLSSIDVDNDGLITFWDLNDDANQDLILESDTDNNDFIDAYELLRNSQEGGWADNDDNDENGMVDDLIGWDFVENDNDPFDETGHGTAVAGIIGAENSSELSGITSVTSMMALRVLDENLLGLNGNVDAASNYAAMMANRMTELRQSLQDHGEEKGWQQMTATANSYTDRSRGSFRRDTEASIKALAGADVLFVAAAGNGGSNGENKDNDLIPLYPPNYELPNVVSVTGADQNGVILYNFGETSVDLVVPGKDIRTTGRSINGGATVASFSGSSAAAPQVTGMFALLHSLFPFASTEEIRDTVFASAQSRDDVGYGWPNAFASLRSVDRISPRAMVEPVARLTTERPEHRITVRYFDNLGFDATNFDANNIEVRHRGSNKVARVLRFTDVNPTKIQFLGERPLVADVEITFELKPEDNDYWTIDENGVYDIFVHTDRIVDASGLSAERRGTIEKIGEFEVQIAPTGIIDVNRFDDVIVSDDDCETSAEPCSLRSAVLHAMEQPGENTIMLQEGRYVLTESNSDPEDDVLSNLGDLDIIAEPAVADHRVELRVTGLGPEKTIIDAGGLAGLSDRIFHVHPRAKLVISDLTITGGFHTSSGEGGGAILNSGGDLRVRNVVLTGNESTQHGKSGGAIYSRGSLVIESSVFGHRDDNEQEADLLGNHSHNLGGAVVSIGETRIHSSTFRNNTAGNGGGVVVVGSLTMGDTQIVNNSASDSIGGLWFVSGTGMISNSDISSNCANTNCVDLEGLRSSALGRVGGIRNDGDLTLVNSSIDANASSIASGGVESYGVWTMIGGSIRQNSSSQGGGIIVHGSAHLDRVFLEDNDSRHGASAIENYGVVHLERSHVGLNHVDELGAAIINHGDLFVDMSSVSQNDSDGGVAPDGNFETAGGILNSGSAEIRRSTISSNRAFVGAGIYNTGSIEVRNATISSNQSQEIGGGFLHLGELAAETALLDGVTVTNNNSIHGVGAGIYVKEAANFEVSHSILAGNSVADQTTPDANICVASGTLGPSSGTCLNTSAGFTSLGNNLVQEGGKSTEFFGSNERYTIDSIDQVLLPLRVYSGFFPEGREVARPLRTHLLAHGSPAIDAGIERPNNDDDATDQRGISRFVDAMQGNTDGAHRDIGAVERYFSEIAGSVYERDANGTLNALKGWYVFVDLNEDGEFQKESEPSGKTDSQGAYIIRGLPPTDGSNQLLGDGVTVRLKRPHGWLPIDADEYHLNLAPAEVSDGNDFVIRSSAEIRGTFFSDANGDGIQDLTNQDRDGDNERDPSDLGLPGWQVRSQKFTKSGLPSTVSYSDVTDETGDYGFVDLSAGRHLVRPETRPDDFRQTFPLADPPNFSHVDANSNNVSLTGHWHIKAPEADTPFFYFGGTGVDPVYPISAPAILSSGNIDLSNAKGQVVLDLSHRLDISSQDVASVYVVTGTKRTQVATTAEFTTDFSEGFHTLSLDQNESTPNPSNFVANGVSFNLVPLEESEAGIDSKLDPSVSFDVLGAEPSVNIANAGLEFEFQAPLQQIELQIDEIRGDRRIEYIPAGFVEPIIIDDFNNLPENTGGVDVAIDGNDESGIAITLSGEINALQIAGEEIAISGIQSTIDDTTTPVLVFSTNNSNLPSIDLSDFVGNPAVQVELEIQSNLQQARTEEIVFTHTGSRKTYGVLIKGFDGSPHPNYHLRIDGPHENLIDVIDSHQPNNTIETSTVLDLDLPVNEAFQDIIELDRSAFLLKDLSLHESNGEVDIDYFQIVPASPSAQISAYFSHENGELTLDLFESSAGDLNDAQLVARSNNTDLGATFQYDQFLVGSDYFLRVSGVEKPEYELAFDFGGIDRHDRIRRNESFETATELSSDNAEIVLRANSIHDRLDRDIFVLEASQSGSMVVEALFDHNVSDLNLFVFEQSCLDNNGCEILGNHELIFFNSESGNEGNEPIKIEEGNRYFIEILAGVFNSAASYDLLISLPDQFTFDDPAFPLPLDRPGQSLDENNPDLFPFHVSGDGEVTITLQYDASLGDIYAHLIDSAGDIEEAYSRGTGWRVNSFDVRSTGAHVIDLEPGEVKDNVDFGNQPTGGATGTENMVTLSGSIRLEDIEGANLPIQLEDLQTDAVAFATTVPGQTEGAIFCGLSEENPSTDFSCSVPSGSLYYVELTKEFREKLTQLNMQVVGPSINIPGDPIPVTHADTIAAATANNQTIGATVRGMASGDFNLDGCPDIVITDSNSRASIVLSNDASSCTDLPESEMRYQRTLLDKDAQADEAFAFNLDDTPEDELITADITKDTVSIWRSLATERDQVGSIEVDNLVSVSALTSQGIPSVVVFQIDIQDQRQKLQLALIQDKGNGFEYDPATRTEILESSDIDRESIRVLPRDINDDGLTDFVVLNLIDAFENVAIDAVFAQSNGTFETERVWSGKAAWPFNFRIEVADFVENSDDVLDIAFLNNDQIEFFQFLPNIQAGPEASRFQMTDKNTNVSSISRITGMFAHDMNQDGKVDLIVNTTDPSLESTGNIGSAPVPSTRIIYGDDYEIRGPVSNSVGVAILNSAGIYDLIAFSLDNDEPMIAWVDNQSLTFRRFPRRFGTQRVSATGDLITGVDFLVRGTPPKPICVGDVDLDGSVGEDDLILLRDNFGKLLTGANRKDGDLDGDGDVDADDFWILSSRFGSSCDAEDGQDPA